MQKNLKSKIEKITTLHRLKLIKVVAILFFNLKKYKWKMNFLYK